jgi:DNA-binding SARP family transcriptional activator/cytochrome c-type biogenesis protein CcmH/NrfG/TolB-like protein
MTKTGAANDWRLVLLGPPALVNGQKVVQVPEKLFALAAYLVLSGTNGLARRAQLAEVLWDNATASQGNVNLRQLLMRLRKRQQEIGLDLLAADDHNVWINENEVQIDLRELQELARSLTAATIVDLAQIYRGDLLEGHSPSGTELDEWLLLHRTKLRDEVGRALLHGLERSDIDLSGEQICLVADSLLRIDPYQEVAYRALMRANALEGRMDRVRSVFAACQGKLKAELGVSPESKTVQLYLHLQSPRRPAPVSISRLYNDDADSAAPPREPVVTRLASEQRDDLVSGVPKISVLMPVGSDSGALTNLACSLVEDLTIGLCRRRTLSVIAPYTAWQLSLSREEVDAHEQFGIDYLVHTHVQGFHDESLFYVKIVDARTRHILWAEEFQFGKMSTSARYKDLSLKIILTLSDQIERIELARYEREQDPKAYHWYLLGRQNLKTLDLAHIRRARKAFRTAVSISPSFAPAMSGIAQTLHLEWLLLARGENELLQEAESIARQAVTADSDDERGFRELGTCSLYAGRFDDCLGYFAEGERLNPQHADLLADYANALTHCGDAQSGLRKIECAMQLNPLSPDHYYWTAGSAKFLLEDYAKAVDHLSRMQDQSPAYRLLAACWAMAGDNRKANDYARKAMDIYPDFRIENWLSIVPLRNLQQRQHYAAGLKLAGFD